jgi:quinol monooxygenase YgiN
MVISTLRFVPSAKRHSEVLEILRSVVGPAASQPGCLSCRIYEEDGPDQATVFCGHWKTSAALHEHVLSDLYLRVLAACELSDRPPEFSFHHVAKTQGMDLIQQLRGHGTEKNKHEPFA